MSYKHMHRYVNETSGRLNMREKGPLERMEELFRGMEGKYLPWDELVR